VCRLTLDLLAFLTLQLSPDSPPLLPPSPVLGPCLMFSLLCIILSWFFLSWFCVLFWFDIDFASFFLGLVLIGFGWFFVFCFFNNFFFGLN
jgi:hypothetical protein